MTRAVLDRGKLASVLGMLGSAADCERAAAGLLATRMVKAAGLDWHDLLQPAPTSRPASRPAPPRQSPAFDQQRLAALEMCRHYAAQLTGWEMDFLAGIARRRTLSPKQLATLTSFAAELPGRVQR